MAVGHRLAGEGERVGGRLEPLEEAGPQQAGQLDLVGLGVPPGR